MPRTLLHLNRLIQKQQKTYVNIIAVAAGHENDEGIVALVDALKSDAIKTYIEETYDGAVVPFN